MNPNNKVGLERKTQTPPCVASYNTRPENKVDLFYRSRAYTRFPKLHRVSSLYSLAVSTQLNRAASV